jgi:hypothetical protein
MWYIGFTKKKPLEQSVLQRQHFNSILNFVYLPDGEHTFTFAFTLPNCKYINLQFEIQ